MIAYFIVFICYIIMSAYLVQILILLCSGETLFWWLLCFFFVFVHAASFYTTLKISHINIAKFPNDYITLYLP